MNILKLLNIPLISPSRIPVTKINEVLKTNSTDKRMLESHISAIKLVSILNEGTIKIRSYVDENYSFQTIYVLQIELKLDDSINEIARLLHSAFPESTLILLEYKDKQYLSAASKRINKLDQTKTVIDDCITVQIVKGYNDLSFKKCVSNLKELYDYILKLLYMHKAYLITGIIPNNDIDYKKTIKEFEDASTNINRLKKEYKDASMLAEKAKIDDELYRYEKQLQTIINSIKGVN